MIYNRFVWLAVTPDHHFMAPSYLLATVDLRCNLHASAILQSIRITVYGRFDGVGGVTLNIASDYQTNGLYRTLTLTLVRISSIVR